MGKKNDAGASKPAQVTVILRLVAGAYLVYLAYGLLQEYLKPVGGGLMLQIGAAAAFGVIGIFLAGWSLRKFIKGEYLKYGESIDEDDADEDEDVSGRQ